MRLGILEVQLESFYRLVDYQGRFYNMQHYTRSHLLEKKTGAGSAPKTDNPVVPKGIFPE